MADVSCSVSVSRKHSDASGVSSKHIYDGVFSAPAPTKLRDSAFSFRIDDYREIFFPSKASLGLSIPTLDLPAADQSDAAGDCWSSSVDYAGVFGGLGDDSGVEISADELFLKSKRRSKRNSRRSRSSKQMKMKSPKGQESSCVSGNNQTSTNPAQTYISPSESQELCGSSRNNQTSTSVSSHKPCDIVKDFSDSHHKTNQSKDGTDGTASIACLHTAPQNTPMFDEVVPSRKTGLGEANRMSMNDADLKMDVGEGGRQGKHTRVISDLGIDKEGNDHEVGLQKEFDRDKCYAFDASHNTQEVNCESQTYMEPTLSSSPQIFSTNHNFSKSSSQSSKSSTSYQQISAAADLSPLLDQELDVNSAAAASAAAMKRAIEEAEAEIRLAKEFFKGKELNGPGKLSFKDIFKVKTTSETNHSYGACGLKQDGSPKVDAAVQNQSVDEDNIVQKEDDLNNKATSKNNDFHEAGGLKSQNNLNATAITEDHVEEQDDSLLQPEFLNGAEFEDIAYSLEVLKSAEKSHKHEGIGEWEPAKQFSQLLTGVKNRFVSFISKQADTDKTVLQVTEQSSSGSMEQSERSTYQVQDADAHMRAANQDRLEKEVEINGSVSSEFGESAQDSNSLCIEIRKPEENDVITTVALEQEKVEEVTISSDVKMPITEQSDPSESEKVEEVAVSSDVKMLFTEQSDPSEPDKELDKVEVQESVEVKHTLMQKDEQDQNQEIVEDSKKREDDEKSLVENNELEQHDMTLDATYETRSYGSTERDCDDNKGTEEQIQIQGVVEKGVYESLDGEDGNWRQDEGFIRVDMEMPIDCEKELKDVERVEDTISEELEERVLATEMCTREYSETFAFQDVKGKEPVGLIEVADDTSEHDEACEHDESLLLSQNKEAYVHVETSKYAQLGESSSKVEGRMVNLATNAIESKVSDKQPVIEPKVNEEQPILETHVNDEQPIIEPQVNDEQPNIEPKVNDEQSIIEPKVNDEQPIIEPQMNDEQPIVEPKVNDEQPIIEPKVNDEQPIIEAEVNDEQPIIEIKVNVEQPICFEIANQLDNEDITEQPRRSFEVVADIFPEHDNCFPAVDICELDEKSSLNRTEEASGCDDSNQYAHDVSFAFEKGGMAQSTNTTSETKGNLEQLSFVHTVNELVGKEMCEPTGCSIEAAYETLDHNECPTPADDVCMTEEHSYLSGKDEDYGHSDRNQCAQKGAFSFEDERVTESPIMTSEPELIVEQPSSVQTATSLIGGGMNGTSTSAGDPDVMEDTHEVPSHKNILKVQQETDLNFEQKHVDEETFPTDIGLENQADEFVCTTDTEEVDMASDQDKTTYDVETSNKRKRWFEKDEIYQTDILLGDEINQEVNQENTEGSKVEDRVEIHFDEIFGEYYSGLEDGHCTEPTHQRRRWFQYSGEEAMHKPIVFDVAGMTTEMDDEIVEESELDDSFGDCVDNLTNEKKEPTDVQDKDIARNQVENTAHAGAAPRRRKWFENGEKSGPAKRPSILVDNVIDADPEEIAIGADAAIHDEPGEKSTSGVMSNKPHDQLNYRKALKEKERMAVERAIREARQRAFTVARKKAAAAAKDKQRKASSEAKTGSGRASTDAKLRVERAAVERATAEARERALQKAVSAKMAYESKEKDPKNQTSGSSCSKGYASEPFTSETSSGTTSESPQRSKAVSERNRRTMERAAKALEEKNMRDSIAQKEQAERDMLADALDGEVKRWLIGKDGNLRSLLSTLQYILGPDSGWQPIPLTDLVDPTAVRKAYKRAALCVHPDKLQQRGATVQQKYICEKVFDLLKDAWQWHELCPDDI